MLKTIYIIKKHKFLSFIVFFLFYSITVSLMSCFHFGKISRVMFIGGIVVLPSIIRVIIRGFKKINKKLDQRIESAKEKLSEKKLAYLKALVFIMMISSLFGGISFCIVQPIRGYANFIVEQFYPKFLQTAGNTFVKQVEIFTTSHEENSSETSEENSGGDNCYVACAKSTMLVATNKDEYQVDYNVIESCFWGIDEAFSEYEIQERLEYNIYGIEKTKTKKSDRLREKSHMIQLEEDALYASAESAKKYTVNSTKWREIVPSTTELIEIADERERIIASGLCDYEFFNLLSYNYQDIALEIGYVSDDISEPFFDYDAVLYYYCMSIIADKKAYSVANNSNQEKECLRRIAMRYHDIASYYGIDNHYRNVASIICRQICKDKDIDLFG